MCPQIGKTIQINRNGLIIISIFLLVVFLLLRGFNYSDKISANYLSNGHFNQYIDLHDLLSASIDAAKRGGLKVYKIREGATLRQKSKGKTAEGANDPVTDGDMQSHIEMYHSIQNAFPYISVVSEESSAHTSSGTGVLPANVNVKEAQSIERHPSDLVHTKDVQVWIDPLDATQEYTEDLRQFVTTMVCVAVKGVPTIGVIHKPFDNFTAWAWVARGHNPNIEVGTNENTFPESPVRVIVSRSHQGPVATQAEKSFDNSVEITPAGGAGYKVLEVLSGRQDLYLHTTLIKKWDICAGNAILNHFKGHMTTITGETIDYSSSIEYKNPFGLVATLNRHDYYIRKLNPE